MHVEVAQNKSSDNEFWNISLQNMTMGEVIAFMTALSKHNTKLGIQTYNRLVHEIQKHPSLKKHGFILSQLS